MERVQKCKTLKFNLEERRVDYTCRMIDVAEALPATKAGNYSGQLHILPFACFLIMKKHRGL